MLVSDPIVARTKLAIVDLSKLPYKFRLTMVKYRDIPAPEEHIVGKPTSAFYMKLVAHLPDRDTGVVNSFTAHLPIDFNLPIEEEALRFVRWFMDHETCELFMYDGKRLRDPHISENCLVR